ncbi:MAG: hypothetical protein ABSC29_04090 [Minisyncoccia bacterium]|jgi:hypothetical protein
MYVHKTVLLVMALLYVYLIVTDIRLHRRIEKLEKTVLRLEGANGTNVPKRQMEEDDLL